MLDIEKNNFVRLVAGVVVVGGFLLGWFVNKWFFLINLFAGLNLIQSCKTGVCPPEMFHSKFINKEIEVVEEELKSIKELE